MRPSAEELIKRYALREHAEGGFFLETYRSTGSIPRTALPEGFGGDRAYSTAILFLLPEGSRSKLHRLRADEVWHLYLGGPLRLSAMPPDRPAREVLLGTDLAAGQKLQHTVPAGCWFGAAPEPGSGYALVGCTMSPGFDFEDFELGRREDLLKSFPSERALIERLT